MSARQESESAGRRAHRKNLLLSRVSASAVLAASVLNPVNAETSSAEVLGATTAPQIVLVSFTGDTSGHLYAPAPMRTPDPLAGILEEPVTGIPKERQNNRKKNKQRPSRR